MKGALECFFCFRLEGVYCAASLVMDSAWDAQVCAHTAGPQIKLPLSRIPFGVTFWCCPISTGR